MKQIFFGKQRIKCMAQFIIELESHGAMYSVIEVANGWNITVTGV